MSLEYEIWCYTVINELIFDELVLANWADALAHYNWYEKVA